MDTLRGKFADGADQADDRAYDADDDFGLENPLSPVGDDERRMQVRAYNYWASLLENHNFPSVDDLELDDLPDFGPYSVLLDFSYGVENPGIAYLGAKIAEECDATDAEIDLLSDVPSRTLLSRITDHYMQIMANQAPIGFEAEFVNRTGRTMLYRGILLPFSSDDDNIDFIYGVINWKALADQQSTDELMLEIDQALEEEPTRAPNDNEAAEVSDAGDTGQAHYIDGEAETALEEHTLELDESAALEQPAGDDGEDEEPPVRGLIVHGLTPMGKSDPVEEGDADDGELPVPSFGWEDEEGEEEEEDDFQISSPLPDPMPGDLQPTYSPLMSKARNTRPIFPGGPVDPVSDEADAWEAFSTQLPQLEPEALEREAFEPETFEPEAEAAAAEDIPGEEVPAEIPPAMEAPVPDSPASSAGNSANGLGDELATARELANTALVSEDRTRHALYEAIGKAYDFSLAAAEAPEEFEELVVDAGLTVQDRAPMTPVVKLVFGAEYDKTRLTEYAAALSHAHRLGLARGTLAAFIDGHDGRLKGVVQTERRLRREESGETVEPADNPRERIAKKLHELAPMDFSEIGAEGAEFALVMIHRTPQGEVVMLGEVPEDVALVERAAKKLLG